MAGAGRSRSSNGTAYGETYDSVSCGEASRWKAEGSSASQAVVSLHGMQEVGQRRL